MVHVYLKSIFFCFQKYWEPNPLQPGVAFLHPLKTSENLKVFWCFQGGIDKQHQAVMD